MNSTDLKTLLPLLILTGWACLLLLVDLFIPVGYKKWTGWLALIGLAAAGAGMLAWPSSGYLVGFNGMVVADGFSLFLNGVFLLSAALAI